MKIFQLQMWGTPTNSGIGGMVILELGEMSSSRETLEKLKSEKENPQERYDEEDVLDVQWIIGDYELV